MKHIWNQSNLSDYATISISVDSETIEKVGRIFKCPSEIHLDVNYQSIIRSTNRRQLIECQPASETKQKEKTCRNSSWSNRNVSMANIGGQIFSVVPNLLFEAPSTISIIMVLLWSTIVLLSNLSTHLKTDMFSTSSLVFQKMMNQSQ